MKEIKFRAWDKHKKVFIPTEVWAVVTTDFNAFGVMLKDWENYKEGEYFYSNSQELSQFTGLRDRNGREIYEGDIVYAKTNYHTQEKRFGWQNIEIFHEDITFKGRNSMGHVYDLMEETDEGSYEWEVKGNIYENPELLNNQ